MRLAPWHLVPGLPRTTVCMDSLCAVPRSSVKTHAMSDNGRSPVSQPRHVLFDLSNDRQRGAKRSCTVQLGASPDAAEQLAAALQTCCTLQTSPSRVKTEDVTSPSWSRELCTPVTEQRISSTWLGQSAVMTASPGCSTRSIATSPSITPSKRSSSLFSPNAPATSLPASAMLNSPTTGRRSVHDSSTYASPASSFGGDASIPWGAHFLSRSGTAVNGNSMAGAPATTPCTPMTTSGISSEPGTFKAAGFSTTLPASSTGDIGMHGEAFGTALKTDTFLHASPSPGLAWQFQPEFTAADGLTQLPFTNALATPCNATDAEAHTGTGIKTSATPPCLTTEAAHTSLTSPLHVPAQHMDCGRPTDGSGMGEGAEGAAMVFARSTCRRSKAARRQALLSDDDDNGAFSPQATLPVQSTVTAAAHLTRNVSGNASPNASVEHVVTSMAVGSPGMATCHDQQPMVTMPVLLSPAASIGSGYDSPMYTHTRTVRQPQSVRRRIISSSDSGSDAVGIVTGARRRRYHRLLDSGSSSRSSNGREAAEAAQGRQRHHSTAPHDPGMTGGRRSVVIISDGSDGSPVDSAVGRGRTQPAAAIPIVMSQQPRVVQRPPVTATPVGRTVDPNQLRFGGLSIGTQPPLAATPGNAGRNPLPAPPSPAPWSCFKPVATGRRRMHAGPGSPGRQPTPGAGAKGRQGTAAGINARKPQSNSEGVSSGSITTSDSDPSWSGGSSAGSDSDAALRGQVLHPPRRAQGSMHPSSSGSDGSRGSKNGGRTLDGSDGLEELAGLLRSATISQPKRQPHKPMPPANPGGRTAGSSTIAPAAPVLCMPTASLVAAPKRKAKLTPAQRQFLKDRESIAQQLYDGWNEAVFGNALPRDLPLVWNSRLVSTAGQVLDDGSQEATKTSSNQRVPCRLELSPGILNTLGRLRSTLGHEICHVAAWVISHEYTQPHGDAFWRWADALMAHDRRVWEQTQPHGSPPRSIAQAGRKAAATATGRKQARSEAWLEPASGRLSNAAGRGIVGDEQEEHPGPLVITRLHNFETHMPFRWQCSNSSCNKLYQRHRNTIDTAKHVCSHCKSALSFLGKFNKDNKPVAGPGLIPGTPSAGQAGGATPAHAAPAPNAYREYFKTQVKSVKAAHPPGTPMSTIMKAIGAQWTIHKQQQLKPQCAPPASSTYSTMAEVRSPRSPRNPRSPLHSPTTRPWRPGQLPLQPKPLRSPTLGIQQQSMRGPEPGLPAGARTVGQTRVDVGAGKGIRLYARTPVLLPTAPQALHSPAARPTASALPAAIPRRLVLELSDDEE